MIFDPDFINKWTGQKCDFDGYYGTQCMDLMHYFITEVLGLSGSVLAAPSAAQVWNLTSSYFDKITNTPTGVPQKGDIIIFGTKIGASGHVCIFIDGDVNSFRSFDANWPLGSLPHIQTHNYTGVMGWFRMKPPVHVPVITTKDTSQETPIPFNVIRQDDSSLDIEVENVQIAGVNGLRTIITRTTYSDGVVTKSEIVGDTTQPATDEIIEIGTNNPTPPPVPEPQPKPTLSETPDLSIRDWKTLISAILIKIGRWLGIIK